MNPIGMPPAASWSGFGGVQGNLPWNAQGSGAGALSANTPQGVAGAYQGAYNSSLGMNQSNYASIMAGYGKTIAAHTSAQQAIMAGYSDVYNSVIGDARASYAAQGQQLQNQATQSGAKMQQYAIDHGFASSSVMSSLQQGVNNQLAQQQQQLTGQMVGQVAQYGSNIGLAGLNSQQHGLDAISGIQQNQLGFMASADFQYPNAGAYGNLAQMAGQTQAMRNNPLSGGAGNLSGGGRPGPQLGYSSSNPYYGGTGVGDVGGGSFGSGVASQAFAGYGGGGGNAPNPAWQMGGANYTGGGGWMGQLAGNGYDASGYGGGGYGAATPAREAEYGGVYGGGSGAVDYGF